MRRGQAEGTFRTDLPFTWLVGVVHHVLHGAAEEIRADRVASEDAARIVIATVHPILAPSSHVARPVDRGRHVA